MGRFPTERPASRPRPAELSPTNDLDALRRENESLRRTLAARKLIEQAKGILMLEEGLSEPVAFRRIQKTSMGTRTPMDQVARAVTAGDWRPSPPAW